MNSLLGQSFVKFITKSSINNGQVFRFLSTATNATERYANYKWFRVTEPHKHVLHVELNRPKKRNAFLNDSFKEIKSIFDTISDDRRCRAVVLSGEGKMFCSGIDYMDLMRIYEPFMEPPRPRESENDEDTSERDDIASRANFMRKLLEDYQSSFVSITKCPKPVIAAIHSGCIGLGVDLISATDVRYASKDAFFSIREVALGLAADIGTLQRVPKIVGNDSLVRELAFSGRDLPADEALQFGLINRIFETKEETVNGALEMAKLFASKSPVAVQGSKVALNYSRDNTVNDGLQFMSLWNMSMLQSEDLIIAGSALASKQEEDPKFADL